VIGGLGMEPLIVLAELSELRERVVRTFHRLQAPLNVTWRRARWSRLRTMAAEGMGIGIVPRNVCAGRETSGELVMKTDRRV